MDEGNSIFFELAKDLQFLFESGVVNLDFLFGEKKTIVFN
jgi:hypothetical protein